MARVLSGKDGTVIWDLVGAASEQSGRMLEVLGVVGVDRQQRIDVAGVVGVELTLDHGFG